MVGDVHFERVVGDVDEVNVGFLIHPDNADSVRVAERCGFTLEGRIRQGWFHRGSWHDVLVYGLVRNELDGVGSMSGAGQVPGT